MDREIRRGLVVFQLCRHVPLACSVFLGDPVVLIEIERCVAAGVDTDDQAILFQESSGESWLRHGDDRATPDEQGEPASCSGRIDDLVSSIHRLIPEIIPSPAGQPDLHAAAV